MNFNIPNEVDGVKIEWFKPKKMIDVTDVSVHKAFKIVTGNYNDISVKSNDTKIKPFTLEFATTLLQIAINMAPYRTGNLRSNIAMKWHETKIEIIYNYRRTAKYTQYLNSGAPSDKWKGFIEKTESVIQLLVAEYIAGKTSAKIAELAQGLVRMDNRQVKAVNVVKTTKKIMGYERKRLKELGYAPETLTKKDVGNLDILKNPQPTSREWGKILTPTNVLEKDLNKNTYKKGVYSFLKEGGQLKEAVTREGKYVKGLGEKAKAHYEVHNQYKVKQQNFLREIKNYQKYRKGLATMNENKKRSAK